MKKYFYGVCVYKNSDHLIRATKFIFPQEQHECIDEDQYGILYYSRGETLEKAIENAKRFKSIVLKAHKKII